MQLKMGGKFHLRLNIGERPIANKYREGKMKRTLKRELKVLEIVKRETIEASSAMECSAVPLSIAAMECLLCLCGVRKWTVVHSSWLVSVNWIAGKGLGKVAALVSAL